MRMPVPLGLEVNPARHPGAGAQFLLNMRAEMTRSESKASVPIALFRNEGITEFLTGLAGAVRGARVMREVLYSVAGTTLYRVNADATVNALGTVAGAGAVDMSDNGIELGIVNSAGTGYIWNEDTDTFVTISDPDFEAAAWIEFLDQFFIFGRLDGEGFFLSALASGTVYDALDVAAPESNPDKLLMGKVVNRDLLLFGTDSLEIWYNAGDADFPLARAPDGTVEIGSAARHSVDVCDNAAMWLAREKGGLSIRRLEGRTPMRVSTAALDDLFDSFGTVDDAIGQSYSFAGHSFYSIIFPTEQRTFTWDAMTKLWHERSPRFPESVESSFHSSRFSNVELEAADWTSDDPGWTVDGGTAEFEGTLLLGAAGGSPGTGVILSADGAAWTLGDTWAPNAPSSSAPTAWSSKLGIFLTVNGNVSIGKAWTSPNGKSWQQFDISAFEARDLLWIDELELFITCGGSGAVWTSPDGTTWTEQTTPSAASLLKLVWSPDLGLLLAFGTSSTTYFYSSDAVTWQSGTLPDEMHDGAWSPELALFVLVGTEATAPMARSADGINWTGFIPATTAADFRQIAWSPELALFVALEGGSGVGGGGVYSEDAVTWTDIAGLATGSIGTHAFQWVAGIGKFVALENSTSLPDQAWWSEDGITWTETGNLPGADNIAWQFLTFAATLAEPGTATHNTRHPVTEGQTFSARATIASEVGARVGIAWYDDADALLSTDFADEFITEGTSKVSATAPVNAASAAAALAARGDTTITEVGVSGGIYATGTEPVVWVPAAMEFAYGKVFIGDSLDGRIGYIDRDADTEFDFPIPWATVSSPITKDRRLLTFNRLEVEIDAGRSDSDDPLVYLSWSDDDGRTWSKSHPRSMGASGKYKTRLTWFNLGSSRSRIFRLLGDDPSPTAIVAAYCDVTMGA